MLTFVLTFGYFTLTNIAWNIILSEMGKGANGKAVVGPIERKQPEGKKGQEEGSVGGTSLVTHCENTTVKHIACANIKTIQIIIGLLV